MGKKYQVTYEGKLSYKEQAYEKSDCKVQMDNCLTTQRLLQVILSKILI